MTTNLTELSYRENLIAVAPGGSTSYDIQAADSGSVYLVSGSLSSVLNLPAAAAGAGLKFTLVQKVVPGAGVGLALNPVAADKFVGNGFTPAVNKDAINTQASGVVGDKLTVVSDGVDTWYITEVVGTWARQA